MSAPSNRSRRVTKSLEAIISSAGRILQRMPRTLVILRAINPRLFDSEGGITNSGNEVDKVVAVTRLGKPDWILHVGLESLLHQEPRMRGALRQAVSRNRDPWWCARYPVWW